MITLMRAAALALVLPLTAQAEETAMTRIHVIVGDDTLPAMLDDSAAARDFAAMLPLELTLTDYNGIEKVGDLGRRLDTTGMPASYTPAPGDITQYGPWENLAIFLEPFAESRGLVRLGQFDGPIDALRAEGPIEVRIERAE